MNIKANIINHMFFYIVIICLVGALFSSFYRFIIKDNYVVYYEETCDPYTESCFQTCDDNCSYYKKVQKYAVDIYSECGNNITDCIKAESCSPDDRKCTITYCNPKINNDCEDITNSLVGDNKNI